MEEGKARGCEFEGDGEDLKNAAGTMARYQCFEQARAAVVRAHLPHIWPSAVYNQASRTFRFKLVGESRSRNLPEMPNVRKQART